ncbi:MAG: hypothetical protein RIQ60_30 [Pseudomonadota bacterium]|jgi:hypothetical protein
MNKLALLLACIALPVAAVAADAKADPKAAGNPPTNAPAPAAKPKPIDSHAAVQASKQRGSNMGACREEATARGLTGDAYKAAIATCMKQ